jgi:release factor glutamine methyltransferase
VIDSAEATWKDLYQGALSRLGSGSEARWILEEAAGEPWPALIGDGARPSEKSRSRLHAMIDRRLAGEPLQYVLGHWAFRDLDLMVDRRVLIPRPETEQVVEVALEELDRLTRSQAHRAHRAHRAPRPGAGPDAGRPATNQTEAPSRPGPPVVVDLGTGSGAIALSIVAERPRVRVWATDASDDALAVAGANLTGLAGFAAPRVRLCLGSWWSALPEQLRGVVDLLVSNPPYVATREMAGLDPAVRDWEPGSALEAGPGGLEAVEEILAAAPGWLRPGGAAVIEIAPHQAARAERAARGAGFAHTEVRPDLAGRDRVLLARMVATATSPTPTAGTPAAGGTREI